MKPNNLKNEININYTKFYTDDISIHNPALFTCRDNEIITLNKYWENAIDGFYRFSKIEHLVTCVAGNVRIIIAYDLGNSNYKFSQYFLSEMDGKQIYIPINIWFCIHNINNSSSTILAKQVKLFPEFEKPEQLSYKIFNWNAKRP